MSDIIFSDDQVNALTMMKDWYKTFRGLFTVGGYAGTGKTTIIAELRNFISDKHAVAFVTFTGKASSVLRRKLSAIDCLKSNDYCGTIHGLIYSPIIDKKTGDIIGWERREDISYDLIIIDEASMVDDNVLKDLQYYGIPILAVGDHFQLPPVSGRSNLMTNPMARLETIHRQAEGHPIISLSMHIRKEGYIPRGILSNSVAKVGKNHDLVHTFVSNTSDFKNTLILCGFNKTRCSVNSKMRKMFGYNSEFPSEGERVICLKNNAAAKNCPIYNGIIGTVKRQDKIQLTNKSYELDMEVEIDGEDNTYSGIVSTEAFGNPAPKIEYKKIFVDGLDLTNKVSIVERDLDYFDFGYCLSVHKSQGSQAKRVMLIEEYADFWKDIYANWLYTGVTRAEEQLLIVER